VSTPTPGRKSKSKSKKSKKNDDDDDLDSFSVWDTDNPTDTCILEMPPDWDVKVFKKLLAYLYHGCINIANDKESKIISEMAFEFLLDPLMKFCNTTTVFPANLIEPVELIPKRMRKLVGLPIGSDIYFVFQKKKNYLLIKLYYLYILVILERY